MLKYLLEKKDSLVVWSLIAQMSLGYSLPVYAKSFLIAHDGDADEVEVLEQVSLDSEAPIDPLYLRGMKKSLNQPSTIESLQQFETGVAQVEALESADEMPKNVSDIFLLARQKAEILQNTGEFKTYLLNELDIEIPQVFISNYKDTRMVSYSRENIQGQKETGIAVEYFKSKAVIARHFIPIEGIQSFAVHSELCIVLTKDGRIYAMDMGQVWNQAFRIAVPLIQVGSLENTDGIEVGFETSVTAVEAGSTESGEEKPAEKIRAGTAIFYKTVDGKRIKVKSVSEQDIRIYLLATQSILINAIKFQNIDIKSDELKFPEFNGDEDLSSRVIEKSNEIALSASKHFGSIVAALNKSEPVLNISLARNKDALVGLDEHRDLYTPQESKDRIETLVQKAQVLKSRLSKSVEDMHKVRILNEAISTRDFQVPYEGKYLWEVLLPLDVKLEAPNLTRSEAIKKKAKAIILSSATKYFAIFATVGAGILYGPQLSRAMDSLNSNGVSGGSLTLVQKVYALLWPDVLNANLLEQHGLSGYPKTLVISTLFLLALQPIFAFSGWVAAKAMGKKDWSYKKALALMGVRIYGAMLKPFFQYAADFLAQPTIDAVNLGVNPFTKVQVDSVVGRKFNLTQDQIVGFNRSLVGLNRNANLKFKRALISAVAAQEKQVSHFAWLLSGVVLLAEKHPELSQNPSAINPAQLAELVRSEVKRDKGFLKKWQRITQQLYAVLKKKNVGIYGSVQDISPEVLIELMAKANQLKQRVETRSDALNKFYDIRYGWKGPTAVFKTVIDSFFNASNKAFLDSVVPNDFVVNKFWNQFSVDFPICIIIYALWGGRAAIKTPEDVSNLAATDAHWHRTNMTHLNDTADQIRAYGIGAVASFSMVFQKEKLPSEEGYKPAERVLYPLSLQGENTLYGFFNYGTGLIKNLDKANFGGVVMRDIKSRLRTIQANYLFAVLSRMILGGQAFLDALIGHTLVLGTQDAVFGWVWNVIGAADNFYTEKFDGPREKYRNLLTSLSRAARFNDAEALRTHYLELIRLYAYGPNKKNAKKFDQVIQHAERFLNIPEKDQIQALHSLAPFYGLVSILYKELELYKKLKLQGNLVEADKQEEKVRAAYNVVVEQYRNQGIQTDALKQLNAQALTEFAAQFPPIYTTANNSVLLLANFAGAISTTIWSINLMVESYTKTVSLAQKLYKTAKTAISYFGGVWLGQKVVDWLWNEEKLVLKYWMQIRKSLNIPAKLSPCEGYL